MTPALFLGFVAMMAVIVLALTARYISVGAAFRLLTGLLVWFLYLGLMGYFGVLKNLVMRPPGPAFLFLPVILFLVIFTLFVARSSAAGGIALAFPLWILLGVQCFRIGVELFLHRMWMEGVVPKMLTFEGANVDIYIGATAPVIAWLAMRGRAGVWLALVWNVLGLMALANVVSRAVMSAPGPLNFLHGDVPNRMFGTFPFMFIPGFFVPLAVVLHALALRAIRSRLRTEF